MGGRVSDCDGRVWKSYGGDGESGFNGRNEIILKRAMEGCWKGCTILLDC